MPTLGLHSRRAGAHRHGALFHVASGVGTSGVSKVGEGPRSAGTRCPLVRARRHAPRSLCAARANHSQHMEGRIAPLCFPCPAVPAPCPGSPHPLRTRTCHSRVCGFPACILPRSTGVVSRCAATPRCALPLTQAHGRRRSVGPVPGGSGSSGSAMPCDAQRTGPAARVLARGLFVRRSDAALVAGILAR